SRAAAPVLESFMAQEVLPLELVDPWLYHLDTALTALDDGTVLCCREAFTSQGLQQLERHPAVKELLFVPRAEACRFALNVVQVGRTVLSGTLKAPVLNRLLERRGFRVCVVDLSQFHLAGGSAACLVSEVHREGAARRPSRAPRWAGSAWSHRGAPLRRAVVSGPRDVQAPGARRATSATAAMRSTPAYAGRSSSSPKTSGSTSSY